MNYTPTNTAVYTAAFSGAIAGMAVSGWITNPTPSAYTNVTLIAGAFAQAFDQTWNNTNSLNSLEITAITSIVQTDFNGHAPGSFDNLEFQDPNNWAIPAAACVALVLESDAFFISQGINPQIQSPTLIVDFAAISPINSLVNIPSSDFDTGQLSLQNGNSVLVWSGIPGIYILSPNGPNWNLLRRPDLKFDFQVRDGELVSVINGVNQLFQLEGTTITNMVFSMLVDNSLEFANVIDWNLNGSTGIDSASGDAVHPLKSYGEIARRNPRFGNGSNSAVRFFTTNESLIPTFFQTATEFMRLEKVSFFLAGNNFSEKVLRGTNITNLKAQGVWNNGPASNSEVKSNLTMWIQVNDLETPWSNFSDYAAAGPLSDTGNPDMAPDQILQAFASAWDRKTPPKRLPQTCELAKNMLSVVYTAPYFWTACLEDDTVRAIDVESMTVAGIVNVSHDPRRIRLGDDGNIWICCNAQFTVDVVNPQTMQVIARHAVQPPPYDVFVHTGFFYVSTDVNSTIYKYNSTTGTLVTTIDLGTDQNVGTFGYNVVVSPFLYIATHIGFGPQSTLHVLDLSTDTVHATLNNIGRTVYALAVTNGKIYTGNYDDLNVTVIDAASLTILTHITVSVGPSNFGIAPNNVLYVTDADGSDVVAIDTVNDKAIMRFGCGSYPQGAAYGRGYIVIPCNGIYPPTTDGTLYQSGNVVAFEVAPTIEKTITWGSYIYWGSVTSAPTTSVAVKALESLSLIDIPNEFIYSTDAQHFCISYPQRLGLAIFDSTPTRSAVAVTNTNTVVEEYEVCDFGLTSVSLNIQHIQTFIREYSDIPGLIVDCDPAGPGISIDHLTSRVTLIATPKGLLCGFAPFSFGPIFKTEGAGGRPYFECGLSANPFNAMGLGNVWGQNPISTLTAGWAVFIGQQNVDPPTAGNGKIMGIGNVQGNGSFVPLSLAFAGPGLNDGFGSTTFHVTGYLTNGISASAPFEYQVASKTNAWKSLFNGNETHATYNPNVVQFNNAPPVILGDQGDTTQYFCGKFSRFLLFNRYPSVDEQRAVSILSKIKYGIAIAGL